MGIETIRIPLQSETVKPYIKQGDTIPKIVFTFDPGDPISLTGATIKMQLFQKGRKVFDISVGSGITITTDKEFEIDEVTPANNTFPEGVLIGDIEITETSGVKTTYNDVEYTILKEHTT
jgi:hypothetical protein